VLHVSWQCILQQSAKASAMTLFGQNGFLSVTVQ
jgi:hypothetical protein